MPNTFLLSLDYQWTVGGKAVPEAAGRSELVLEAARELDGVTVTCRAANQAGENWADTELHVNCKILFYTERINYGSDNGASCSSGHPKTPY